MASPRKILAIKTRSLGDTVLMTAPLVELRRAYPYAQIDVVVRAPWGPIIEKHPAVNKVWVYERHHEKAARAKALARLGFALRKERYDCVVNFHASPSSAMLAFATGSKLRSIHFHGHRDKNRYSTVEVPGKGVLKPIIERDMDAVRALGLDVSAGKLPYLAVQSAETRVAQERLVQRSVTRPLLAVALGASRPTKSWPVERYAMLAVQWCRETGGSVLTFVGADEEKLGQEFLRQVDEALSSDVAEASERALIRKRIGCETGLSLRLFASLLAECDVFVGNDSGPKHIAVALGTPTVTVFGPEHPFEWHPYPQDLHPYFYIDGLACRKDAQPGMPAWCALDVCVQEEHRCMRQTGVNEVLAKCRQMIGKKARSER